MSTETIHLMNEKCADQFFPGNDTGILLLHGFTGSPAQMLKQAQAFSAAGYTVSVPRLPGHGTRKEDMYAVTGKDWRDRAAAALSALRGTCSRVFIGGLSMGGCLSLILTAASGAQGVFTISAPMGTASPFSALAPVLSPFVRAIHKSPDGHTGLDPEYDFCYSEMATARIADLNAIIRDARACLSGITCPVLAIQSRADRTIRPDSIQIIRDHVSTRDVTTLMLDDVPHTCTISKESDTISQAVLRFFSEHA